MRARARARARARVRRRLRTYEVKDAMRGEARDVCVERWTGREAQSLVQRTHMCEIHPCTAIDVVDGTWLLTGWKDGEAEAVAMAMT
jgi:hypothetical protein